MLIKLDRLLSALPSLQIAGLSVLLIAIVGAFDWITGYELSFSVFYTLPIALGAWYGGRRIGLATCVLAAATWMSADQLSGHAYSHPGIPLWNAGVRLMFFFIIAGLLNRLRSVLHLQTQAAQRDGLTGLLNAAAFRRECNLTLKLAGRHRQPLALCYLDLDGFKGVNDSLGHDAGDQVLKLIADAMKKHLRETDACARIGGDEFAILLPQTDLAGARIFFSNLQQRLVELMAVKHWPIGFSIGVAIFDSPSVSADNAIRFADGLMYRVKKTGKNGILFEVADPGGAENSRN